MKKLFMLVLSGTIATTAFGQYNIPAKTAAKPFELFFNETEANRVFFLISQLKNVVPKSKVPMDEGVSIISNADTVLANIQKQYNGWLASQKKDSAGKK